MLQNAKHFSSFHFKGQSNEKPERLLKFLPCNYRRVFRAKGSWHVRGHPAHPPYTKER